MLESAKLNQYAFQKFGQDLRQVSETLYAKEQETKEIVRRQKLSDSRIGAFTELADLQLGFDVSKDPTTAGDRWKAESDRIYQKYEKGLGGDPALIGAFKEDFESKRLSGSLDVRSNAVKYITDKSVADLDSKSDTLLSLMSGNKDPVREQQIVDEMTLLTQDAVEGGVISAEDAGKRRRDFASKGQEARARNDIILSPETALLRLNDPNSYKGMDEVKRTSLTDMATRRVDALRSDRIRLAEKAERDAEKSLKRQGDDTFKNLSGMAANSSLTRDDIEAAKPMLDPSDYRTLLSDLENQDDPEKVTDDPSVVANFEFRVDSEDIRQDLLKSLNNKEISLTTFRSLNQKNRELRKPDATDGPPSPFKSGREFVKTTLNPSQLLDGPAAAVANSGLANALVEYDNWAAAHPEATRAAAQQQASEIVTRYQVINYSNMSMATGLPAGYVGTRNDLTAADIDEAEDRVMADLDAKRLSEAEALQELRKITSWRAIIEKRVKP